MTNRSNHMPMFTKIETVNMIQMLVRKRVTRKSCGEITLHDTMIQ